MEYHKIITLLDKTPYQSSKFRTKDWVKINGDSRGTYNTNSQIKFRNSMLTSILYDSSDAYTLVKETVKVQNTVAATTAPNNGNNKIIFENCATFIDCISEINNTLVDNAKDIDVVMPIYNLIKDSDNYSKTSGCLWQYCRDRWAVNDDGAIVNFNVPNVTDSFNFKVNITCQTDNNGTKNVKIMVPLKYFSNFWRTIEMSLISCEFSANCVIVSTPVANQGATIAMTDTKLYAPAVTLSNKDNVKLSDQSKYGFKRAIHWKNY